MKKSLITLAVVSMMVAPGAALVGNIESQMIGTSFWKSDTVNTLPVKNSRMIGKELWKSQADSSSSITSKMAGKSLYKPNVQTATLANKAAE